MNRLCAIACLGFHFMLSACAIHPMPEDYAGVSTYHIVRQIRCETREAVISSILDLLTSGKNPNKVDESDRQIGEKFSDRSIIREFRPTLLHGKARKFIDVIWDTSIAYNYNLEMNEINNLDPEINLLRTLSTSTQMFGLKAGFDRNRQSTRTFTVSDTFGDLVSKVNNDYCTDFIAQEYRIYPIAGKIGMARVIHDFINIAIYGNLSGDGTKDSFNPPGPPSMAEQLEFVTTLTASATPKVTFTPLSSGLHVADASFAATATRTDTHKLTIGLAIPSKAAKDLATARNGVFGQLITADRTTSTKQAAAKAIEDLLEQKLFQPTIVVSP